MIHFPAFPAHHGPAHPRTLFLIVEHEPVTPRRAAKALFGRCCRTAACCYPRCYHADICAVPRPALSRPNHCSSYIILDFFGEMGSNEKRHALIIADNSATSCDHGRHSTSIRIRPGAARRRLAPGIW
ncbi:MAG TPA: hypothetical protein VK980_17720 [Sphingomonas sp.]|nr:hypothetical protein [Sphingomonas sp.]